MLKPNYSLMYEAIDTGIFIDVIVGDKLACAGLLAVTQTAIQFYYRTEVEDWEAMGWDWRHQFNLIREKAKDEFIELCLAEMDR
jgi:hypothetical protein